MIFDLDLDKYSNYREQLKKVKDDLLISGIDYNLKKKRITGVMEKDTRPELTKSGAEKILQVLNARVEYSIYKEIENELHYEVILQADLYINDKAISRCWASYSTSEQSKKAEADLIIAKMTKKNNAYKLAQKRAMVQIALLTSGMGEFFSSDLEEGNNGKVELKSITSDVDISEITSNVLLDKIKKCFSLKDLNSVASTYKDYITRFNLKQTLENKRRELWIDWSNKFAKDIEKCNSNDELETLKNKYNYLINSQDFSKTCNILIQNAYNRING